MKSLLARWIGAVFIITAAWGRGGAVADRRFQRRLPLCRARHRDPGRRQNSGGRLLQHNDSTDPQHRIVRYNIDGTTDTTFNGPGGWFGVRCIALQPDGKILITIDHHKTAAYNRVVRLTADGTVDGSFSASYYLNQGNFSALAVQEDGDVLVVGNFTQLGGYSLPFLARLKPAGGRRLVHAEPEQQGRSDCRSNPTAGSLWRVRSSGRRRGAQVHRAAQCRRLA